MNLLILSVSMSTGISRDKQQPFKISNCTGLQAFESVSTPNYQREGTGLIPVEISVSDSFFPALEARFKEKFTGFPVPLDVETAIGRGGRLTIVGFTPKPVSAAIPQK